MRWPFTLTKQTKPKKTKRKPRDTDEELDTILKRRIIKEVKKDPDMAFEMATKRFNLATRDSKETTLIKELDKKVTEATIQKLESSPELMNKAIEKKLDAIVTGIAGISRDSGNPLQELRAQLQDLRALQEELGGEEKEGSGGLITPEVITEALKLVPQLLSGRVAETKYVIPLEDGTLFETDTAGYKAWLEQRSKALGVGKTPTPEPAVKEKPREKPIKDVVQEWLPLLDEHPTVAYTILKERQDKWSSVIINVLSNYDADTIIAMVQGYREQFEAEVSKLEEKRDWLVELIKLVKGESVTPKKEDETGKSYVV